MKIDVCFSPALYPVYHNPEAIVVVVDIFRATTTMAAAFGNGVRSIRPVATVEEAQAYKAKGWLVGAERNVPTSAIPRSTIRWKRFPEKISSLPPPMAHVRLRLPVRLTGW